VFLISVIIPLRPNTSAERVVTSLKRVNYPQKKIEVFLVEGYQPAIQRNKGVEETGGDVLHFFDNDSVVDTEVFNELNKVYSHGDVAVVGGPDLSLDKTTFLQKVFDCALTSYFAHGPMRARYAPIGKLRESNERELIGCNLSVKKNVFKEVGGFNETIYPNEENDFLNRLRLNGYKLIYNPLIFTYRSRAKSVFRFARQFFKYGRGRVKQTLKEPFYLNWIFFLPLIFSIYLIILMLLPRNYFFIPAVLYGLGALVFAGISAVKERRITFVVILPLVYLIMHISYSFGMFSGFLANALQLREKGEQKRVTINKIKTFGENWG
jgi:GT2 family glycosyltransferase